jgi:hypothetical protein
LYLYTCIVFLWLIPRPIVIWLIYGSKECNIYVILCSLLTSTNKLSSLVIKPNPHEKLILSVGLNPNRISHNKSYEECRLTCFMGSLSSSVAHVTNTGRELNDEQVGFILKGELGRWRNVGRQAQKSSRGRHGIRSLD